MRSNYWNKPKKKKKNGFPVYMQAVKQSVLKFRSFPGAPDLKSVQKHPGTGGEGLRWKQAAGTS